MSTTITQLKPLHPLSVALNRFKEHLCGAHPQAVFAVERAIDDHLLQRLGILGESLQAIEVAHPLATLLRKAPRVARRGT